VFEDCIVCGTRTREHVTLLGFQESIPLCGSRCRRLFLSYPLGYMDADAMAPGWSHLGRT
jgi:hypothetical protein